MQPYYLIEFRAVTCLFEIRVNDTPVFSLTLDNKQFHTTLPINHAIHQSGPVEVSIKILPIPGETQLRNEASLFYEIQLYDVEGGKYEMIEPIDSFQSERLQKDEIKLLITDTKIFNATIPYQMNTPWLNGRSVAKIKDAKEKLVKEYNYIAQLIKSHAFDQYEQMISFREQNIRNSMYLTEQESKARFQRLKRDLQNGFSDIEFPETSVMVPSAYGKKASLKRLDGDPALSFVNPVIGEQIMIDIEFYYNKKSDRFEII